jgi:hypothetical protein
MSSIVRVVALAVTLCPLTAGAQIAAIVRPPAARGAARAAPAPVDTTTSEQARHPTTQLTNLTAWVDSAVTANAHAADSVPAADTTRPAHVTPPAHHAAHAMRAPDTASPLPAIVVVGVLMLGVGVALSHGARDIA